MQTQKVTLESHIACAILYDRNVAVAQSYYPKTSRIPILAKYALVWIRSVNKQACPGLLLRLTSCPSMCRPMFASLLE